MHGKPQNRYHALFDEEGQKISVVWKGALVGILVGIIVVLYRLALTHAEELSFAGYAYVREHPGLIPVLFLALGALGYGVGALVSKYRSISGSGIPQVKGFMMGYFETGWRSTLLFKFLGGTLSILAGLSLGREGPSIQLGASVAQGVGDRLAKTRTERKILIASGASAGLAAAFNAPLAGVMFAVEEVFKYLSPVILLSTMVSAILADCVSRVVFGASPVFSFHIQSGIPLKSYWIVCLIGVLLGCAGAFYNWMLLTAQRLYKKIAHGDVRIRLMVPFLLAGVVGLLFPVALGGGHAVVEHLELSTGIAFLLLILAVKFLFSMVSFGAGAPGGIFFPLLIIGGTIGAVLANVAVTYFALDASLFHNLVILAMAGYFAAIVRAPFTGIILLLEMTGSFVELLPLALVAIIASTVADLIKSAPVYDALLHNMVTDQGIPTEAESGGKKITVETVVHDGSAAANKRVRELSLPVDCLLIAIRREGKDIIPKGDTLIKPYDYLIFLVDVKNEARQRQRIDALATA